MRRRRVLDIVRQLQAQVVRLEGPVLEEAPRRACLVAGG